MNWNAVRNFVFMAVAAAGLITLTACGGGGGNVVTPPPPQGDFTNASFINNYAFFYQGSDSVGNPLAVSGQLVSTGDGHISGGLIDIEDASNTLPLVGVQILSTSTYVVNADGQTQAQIDFAGAAVPLVLQFTLASSAHGLITEFDTNGSGSGTIDAQNPSQLATPLAGNFAFNASGVDTFLEETTLGGNLLVNAGGIIPANQSVWDVIEAGVTPVDSDDQGVTGSLVPDQSNPGHGQINLTSPNVGLPLVFSYYVVDATHLKIIEIDGDFFTAGEAFAAPGVSTSLANANYAYTASGESKKLTPQALGGVFISNGSGITGGVQDLNRNASGNGHIKQTIQASTFTPDASLARIDLILNAGGTNFEYAAYPTLDGRVLLSEIDGKQAVASGTAFQQTATDAVEGSYAINLSGLAVNSKADFAQDVVGQVTIGSGGATSGTLQINNIFVALPVPNIVLSSKSMLAALDTPVTGRGNPFALQSTELGNSGYSLSYYVVDDNTVLLLEMDGVRVSTGLMLKQQ
jgi:hypothetical protein